MLVYLTAHTWTAGERSVDERGIAGDGWTACSSRLASIGERDLAASSEGRSAGWRCLPTPGPTPAEPPHEPYTFLKPRREESSEQSSDEGGDVLVTNQASYTSAVASEAERVLDVESRTPGVAVAAVLTFTT